MNDNIRIINTEENLKNIKCDCPHCGASDTSFDMKSGKIRCNFCKRLFDAKDLNNIKDLTKLDQKVIGSGAKDITSDEHIMTIECANCGAEVVIDTSVSTHARCHWCRSILSINNRIPNGTVPDAILPFSVTKEEAIEEINKFVSTRQEYALPKFKEGFTPDNVLGVYLPYLLVDAKVEGKYYGRGECEINRYSLSKYDHRYDAEVYNICRDFEITIDDLCIESNKKILSKTGERTNNIINSIMPFDTDNCVKFESNYLVGYTSEKRDININDIGKEVEREINDVVRASVDSSIAKYNRGVLWNKSENKIKGSQWIAAYLPVWLYSYHEKTANGEIVHYIAVNGRTKETMGSVPLDNSKLIKEFVFFELITIFIGALAYLLIDMYALIFLFIAMAVIANNYDNKKKRYRNATVRHYHEYETKRNINYKLVKDDLYETKIGLKNRTIDGYFDDTITNVDFLNNAYLNKEGKRNQK